jgi:6-pyruvoyltetrahydropterin/6-carboxytetrahydropterin synthase
MVMDLKALKELIGEAVVERLDHRNLTVDVAELRETIPTPENLAIWIWGQLAPRLRGCRLHRVRLHEEQGWTVEYLGDQAPGL